MNIVVEPGTPESARSLLEASHALMESLFPSESNHYLSLDELAAPNIRFLVARAHGEITGCGALAIKDGYGEIKSMFTDERARGQGVADAVLGALTNVARDERISTLCLETGNLLTAAHRLYERHGFVPTGPFGDYPDDPLSLFFKKDL